MSLVQKALWFVESHLREPLTLEGVAAEIGVSPFHLTRAFTTVTGQSLMRYVRARRLSEAARRLCDGAPDILDVALDAGYGSHEAFTRAFHEQFGLAPKELRGCAQPLHLALTEPIVMDATPLAKLPLPRFKTLEPMLVAGLSARLNYDTVAGIPGQWERFQPFIGTLPQRKGDVAYGVCHNFDDDGNFDYMCGVEVTSFSGLPGELATLRMPAGKYAVFRQDEHISTIRRTCAAIHSDWLPQSGHVAADAPMIERYGREFDPRTGMGGYEVWVPIKG